MPPLADAFGTAVARAISLAEAGEASRVIISATTAKQPLYPARLELLYEMAFLRVFIEWETFLEQTFIRYLCGYEAAAGQQPIRSGTYYRTLAAAEAAVLGHHSYKLWHNPAIVISRAQSFFITSLHELVLASSQTRLEWYAAIRHRIAHAQAHARRQFDSATIRLNATRYQGGRPGKFLRDWDTSVYPELSPHL